MKVMMGAVVAIIVLGLLSGTSTAQTQFEAQLDRSQPVPPLSVSGGTGTFSLNADGTELTYEIRVRGTQCRGFSLSQRSGRTERWGGARHRRQLRWRCVGQFGGVEQQRGGPASDG
jgi:hypothetical protein